MINAVAYARFSTDMQREESIEAQVRAIEDYCNKNNYNLVRVFADRGISGTKDNRPEFQKMIDECKQPNNVRNFDIVIVHKLDRFARNRFDSAIYKKVLKESNIKLYSVLENLNDSPESVILESVLDGMAEYYSLNLAREVQKGKCENAYKCKFNGGYSPLGYDINPVTHEYVINETEAKTIKKIFELYVNGHSLIDITIYLNENGYKTKLGKPFRKNSVYDILGSEKYAGYYVYNKGYKSKKRKKRDDTIIVENGIPAIISKEVFDLVMIKRKKNKRIPGSFKSNEIYLLSGLLICSKCNGSYYGTRRIKSKKSKTYYYYKYVCQNRNKLHNCTADELNRDDVENLIISELKNVLLNPNNIDKIVDKINEKYSELYNSSKTDISDTEKEIKDIQIKINNLMRLVSDGLYNDDIKNNLENLENNKTNLNVRLNKLKNISNNKELDKNTIIKAINIDIDALNLSDKLVVKNMLSKYISKIVVDYPSIEIHFRFTSGIDNTVKSATKNRQINSSVCLAPLVGNSTNLTKDQRNINSSVCMAPQVGLEPTTLRLTAACSTD